MINDEGKPVLSDVVGRQVRAHRDAARLTREQVAERCAALGWTSITAAIINYIETGRPDAKGKRRREVSIDELVALASALDVPPLALLAPISDEPWAGSPGPRPVSTASALAWLRGDRRLLGGGPEPAVHLAMRLYIQADAAAHDLYALLGEWEGGARQPDWSGEEAQEQKRPPGWSERYDRQLTHVRSLRAQLRLIGQPTPRLPTGLEWVDPPATPDPDPDPGQRGDASDADALGDRDG